MVDPADGGPAGTDQGLHLEGQVVEEGGELLPEGLLVVAGLAQETHPLDEVEAEPGLQPQPQSDAEGALGERLGRRVGEGNGLVLTAAGLAGGPVAQEVAVDLDRQGASLQQPALQTDAGQVLGPEIAAAQEGVAEGSREHLPPPAGHRPGVGMPVRRRRHLRRTAQRLRRRQRRGRHRVGVEILAAAVEVEHAVDVLHLAASLEQAVAETAGLEVLLTPLETDAAIGVETAGDRVVFEAIGLETATRHAHLDVPGGDEAALLGVVFLTVGGEFDLQRHRHPWGRLGGLRHRRQGWLAGGFGGGLRRKRSGRERPRRIGLGPGFRNGFGLGDFAGTGILLRQNRPGDGGRRRGSLHRTRPCREGRQQHQATSQK